MTLDTALRATEILLALALLQQSAEHLLTPDRDKPLFAVRAALALLLLTGLAPALACAGLAVHALAMLHRFQGPYNGGSDRMSLLILLCLTLAHLAPTAQWRELAFGYLALQLTLSYFISGWVKLRNPEWRSGQALRDVFLFSAYPVSEQLRRLADHPRLLLIASWAVILLEILFPLALLTAPTLILALAAAAAFHLANACLFGLNRFFWAWLAAYPSILWLQGRLFGLE